MPLLKLQLPKCSPYMLCTYFSTKLPSTIFEKCLNEYTKRYYGDLGLTKYEIRQLGILNNVESKPATPDEILNDLHPDVIRSLSRWNCFRLLLDNSRESYRRFTIFQPDNDKLSYESFKKISSQVSGLPVKLKKTLRENCFRLTSTHSLENLYKQFQGHIHNQVITAEQFNVLICQHVLNMAGSCANENPHGSIYLTESVAQSIFDFQCKIDQQFDYLERKEVKFTRR